MRRMTRSILGAFSATMLAGPVCAQPAAPAFGTLIANCEGCHGPKGNSTLSSVPRLNGQQAGYLRQRLEDFFSLTDPEPHAGDRMVSPAGWSDDSKDEVAAYFAAQRPAAGYGASPAGRRIYENGLPAQGVLACHQCHGRAGEGDGLVPRIAGQHADYLATQIWAFGFGLRAHGTANDKTNKLTPAQITAVVFYLSAD